MSYDVGYSEKHRSWCVYGSDGHLVKRGFKTKFEADKYCAAVQAYGEW